MIEVENHVWEHMDANLPDWAKRIISAMPTNELDRKWTVWGGDSSIQKIEDYIKLG